jgi:hypothetical protein
VTADGKEIRHAVTFGQDMWEGSSEVLNHETGGSGACGPLDEAGFALISVTSKAAAGRVKVCAVTATSMSDGARSTR